MQESIGLLPSSHHLCWRPSWNSRHPPPRELLPRKKSEPFLSWPCQPFPWIRHHLLLFLRYLPLLKVFIFLSFISYYS